MKPVVLFLFLFMGLSTSIFSQEKKLVKVSNKYADTEGNCFMYIDTSSFQTFGDTLEFDIVYLSEYGGSYCGNEKQRILTSSRSYIISNDIAVPAKQEYQYEKIIRIYQETLKKKKKVSSSK